MFLLLITVCNWSASSRRRTQSPTSVCCVSWRTPTLALRAKGLIKCLNDLLRDMIMRMGKQFVLISNNCSVYLGYVSTDLGRVWIRESLVMRGTGKKGEVSCYFFFFWNYKYIISSLLEATSVKSRQHECLNINSTRKRVMGFTMNRERVRFPKEETNSRQFLTLSPYLSYTGPRRAGCVARTFLATCSSWCLSKAIPCGMGVFTFDHTLGCLAATSVWPL